MQRNGDNTGAPVTGPLGHRLLAATALAAAGVAVLPAAPAMAAQETADHAVVGCTWTVRALSGLGGDDDLMIGRVLGTDGDTRFAGFSLGPRAGGMRSSGRTAR